LLFRGECLSPEVHHGPRSQDAEPNLEVHRTHLVYLDASLQTVVVPFQLRSVLSLDEEVWQLDFLSVLWLNHCYARMLFPWSPDAP